MPVLVLATTILEALPGLLSAGMNVIALINSTNATINKAQAENRDPTPEEWNALDLMVADLRKQAQS